MQLVIRRHAEVSILLRMIPMPGEAKCCLIALDLRRRTPGLRGRRASGFERCRRAKPVRLGDRTMCLVEMPKPRIGRGEADISLARMRPHRCSDSRPRRVASRQLTLRLSRASAARSPCSHSDSGLHALLGSRRIAVFDHRDRFFGPARDRSGNPDLVVGGIGVRIIVQETLIGAILPRCSGPGRSNRKAVAARSTSRSFGLIAAASATSLAARSSSSPYAWRSPCRKSALRQVQSLRERRWDRAAGPVQTRPAFRMFLRTHRMEPQRPRT